MVIEKSVSTFLCLTPSFILFTYDANITNRGVVNSAGYKIKAKIKCDLVGDEDKFFKKILLSAILS